MKTQKKKYLPQPKTVFPTQADLEFWSDKKRPKWSSKIQLKTQTTLPSISIDSVINSHTVQGGSINHDASNTVSLLKLVRRNMARGSFKSHEPQTMIQYLEAIRMSPLSGDKRNNHVIRFLRRYRKNNPLPIPAPRDH